jgi:protein-tyrosine sulfotransferase
MPGAGSGSGKAGVSADPVFVLCAARSGSTLLRFLLDAHPQLACPPETNVPVLCGQLATVWSLIEGAPLSPNRGDEPPDIPDAAITGVRETMDRMVGSYLARRGKTRYCDKSLGTARFAYLLRRVWPEAKFICLFRHPMDVIASGAEACPWGVTGYGFDPYIAETPGNMVFALARFWADNAGAIVAAQEQYPQACLRVRYEDLVSDTQSVADQVFGFLGVDPVPDIGRRMFAPERERSGPADYKIWHTSQVTTASVGRGWTVPAGLISLQVRTVINDLCGKLDYLPVDDDWGSADRPVDLRLTQAAGQAAQDEDEPAAQAAVPPLISQLAASLTRLGDGFGRRWDPCAAETFEVIITPPGGTGRNASYLVDLPAGTVRDAAMADGQAESDVAWSVIAAADTWKQIISGQVNMSVALRRNLVRYLDTGDTGPVIADTRIGLLSDLLGLASWGQARKPAPPPAKERTRA